MFFKDDFISSILFSTDKGKGSKELPIDFQVLRTYRVAASDVRVTILNPIGLREGGVGEQISDFS